jgi:hypothetical protein
MNNFNRAVFYHESLLNWPVKKKARMSVNGTSPNQNNPELSANRIVPNYLQNKPEIVQNQPE